MSKYLEWKKHSILMAANRWFVPSGLSVDDVVCAYRFKGADSLNAALVDQTGMGFDLLPANFRAFDYGLNYWMKYVPSQVSWDASRGIYSTNDTCNRLASNKNFTNKVENAVIAQHGMSGGDIHVTQGVVKEEINTLIIKYSTDYPFGASDEDHPEICLAYPLGRRRTAMIWLSIGFVNHSYAENNWAESNFSNGTSFLIKNYNAEMRNNGVVGMTWNRGNSGIIGVSWGPNTNYPVKEAGAATIKSNVKYYFNGTERDYRVNNDQYSTDGYVTKDPFYGTGENGIPNQNEQDMGSVVCLTYQKKDGTVYPVYIEALSIYRTALTADQHLEVYRGMMTL